MMNNDTFLHPLSHLVVAPAAGLHERRHAQLINKVDVRPLLQHLLHRLKVALRRGRRQLKVELVAHFGRI